MKEGTQNIDMNKRKNLRSVTLVQGHQKQTCSLKSLNDVIRLSFDGKTRQTGLGRSLSEIRFFSATKTLLDYCRKEIVKS